LFFITIDKRITLILSILWIAASFAGIILNQQYFSGTILTWILAPLFFMLANYAYKQLEKVGIS
jgi:preprotein translocase subunit SecG